MIRDFAFLVFAAGLVSSMTGFAQSPTTSSHPDVIEFRIDTDVYLNESRPPIASTKTLFLKDRIIDWDDASRRMMCIDLATQQIELADFASQRRCRIDRVDLETRLGQLRSQLTPDQLRAWSSPSGPAPDGPGYEMLQSSMLRYRFKSIEPRHPQMAMAYAEFANCSVELNAVHPPFKPPLLRLQLNDYLRDQNRLPTEVQLIDVRSTASDPLVARLLVQESLTKQDRERVKDWEVLVATLKMVSADEYFQSQRVASEGTATKK